MHGGGSQDLTYATTHGLHSVTAWPPRPPIGHYMTSRPQSMSPQSDFSLLCLLPVIWRVGRKIVVVIEWRLQNRFPGESGQLSWPVFLSWLSVKATCCFSFWDYVNILRCQDICHVVFTLLFVYISVPYYIYMWVCVCLCVYYECAVVVLLACLTRKSNFILIGIRNGGTEKRTSKN